VPTTDFLSDFDESSALDAAPGLAGAGGAACQTLWRRLPGMVTHIFTHFPLELLVFRAEVPAATAAPDGMRWIAASEVRGAAFPSLMRKVLAHARIE
jgi:A/G-specific adenine glycosylase